MTSEEKYQLLSELNEILKSGVDLIKYRRIQSIKSLLNSDGFSENVQASFDLQTREHKLLIKLSDGSYQDYKEYLKDRN